MRLPSDKDAERALISGLLYDSGSAPAVFETLNEKDFSSPNFAKIFKAISEMVSDNKPVDSITVFDHIDSDGDAGSSLKVLLVELEGAVFSSVNLDHYADIIKKLAMRREVMMLCKQTAFDASQTETDVEAVIDTAGIGLSEVSARNEVDVSANKPVVKAAFEEIVAIHESGGIIRGANTGFRELDAITGGLRAGELVIAAARPGMGKTSFGLQIARHAAKETGLTSLVFSLEMTKEACAQRLLAGDAMVDTYDLRHGRLNDDGWSRLAVACENLTKLKMAWFDRSDLTISEIKRKARRQKLEGDLGLILVDYLQLMCGHNKDSREREIAEISRGLKNLAKELKVPVLALSQLNRGVEGRVDKRPMLSDLRESGAIEQDADLICMIYREGYYEQHDNSIPSTTEDFAEILIRKNRNGRTGCVELAWVAPCAKFENKKPSQQYGVSQWASGIIGT